jgi:hypothetical protein
MGAKWRGEVGQVPAPSLASRSSSSSGRGSGAPPKPFKAPGLFPIRLTFTRATMHKTAQAKAANALSTCRLPGCTLPRTGLQPWCSGHDRTARRYGHPDGAPIKRRQLLPYRTEVESLLSANEAHEGLLQVLVFLDRWIVEAQGNPRAWKGAQEVARLHAHGVNARRLLVEFLAAALWLQDHGHRLPDDRARDFMLSRAVFSLAPRARKPTGPAWWRTERAKTPASYAAKALPSALAYVGRHLRQALAVFLANVQAGVEAERRQKTDPDAALRAPLRAPSTTRPGPSRAGGLPFA